MTPLELTRPSHLDEPSWAAVEVAVTRLSRARDVDDRPEVIGKAKELVETIAKVVVAASEGTISDAADFAPVVKQAHKALRWQPGVDLSADAELRAVAASTQTIAMSLGPIRNRYGTGHGRAHVPDVVDELAVLALDAAMLWSRWALRRLGHLLADYPNDLINAVQTGTSRAELRSAFDAAALRQQPIDVQHRVGVAFGQQAAGGFGNATHVGVDAAISGEFADFPVAYRRGVLQGMLLTPGGQIGLTEFYVPRWVSLLKTMPATDAEAALEDARSQVEGGTWVDVWRGATPVEPDGVVAALRAAGADVPVELSGKYRAFYEELERTADPSS